MLTNDDTIVRYFKVNGREWVVWISPQNDLVSIPADEMPCSKKDLGILQKYLYSEGYFEEYFRGY